MSPRQLHRNLREFAEHRELALGDGEGWVDRLGI